MPSLFPQVSYITLIYQYIDMHVENNATVTRRQQLIQLLVKFL